MVFFLGTRKNDHISDSVANLLKSKEISDLEVSLTYEDIVNYFNGSLSYVIDSYRKLGFVIYEKEVFNKLFHGDNSHNAYHNTNSNTWSKDNNIITRVVFWRYKSDMDKFRETLDKVRNSEDGKKQLEVIEPYTINGEIKRKRKIQDELNHPPVKGDEIKNDSHNHHVNGGDPDTTDKSDVVGNVDKKDNINNYQHDVVGGDPDTTPEIPDAIGNVDKYTKKKNDYVDLYDGNSDVDDVDKEDNHIHPHHVVGGDPDPEVKSWWQQFLKEHPSINKSLTYMDSHPVATAAGATLVALGMYGAAKLWKKYKEKKKQQAHNK